MGLFYKKLENAIAYGRAVRDITNNGSTQDVTIRGPTQRPEQRRHVEGLRNRLIRRSSTNLPGAWSGLGVQVNYTRTDQDDINNSNLAVQAGYLPGSTTAFGGGNNTSTGGQGNAGNPLSFTSNVIDSHRLAGISDRLVQRRGPVRVRQVRRTAGLQLALGVPAPRISIAASACRSGRRRTAIWMARSRYGVNDNVELSLDVSNILEYHCGDAAAGVRRFDADAGREAGEARFGLGQQRPALSSSACVSSTDRTFVGAAVPPAAPTIFSRTRARTRPAHRHRRRRFRRLDVLRPAAQVLHPERYRLTLIESDDIGTVGVGEATLPALRDFNDAAAASTRRSSCARRRARSSSASSFATGIVPGEHYVHPFGSFGQLWGGVEFQHHWMRARQRGLNPAPLEEYSCAVRACRRNAFDFPDSQIDALDVLRLRVSLRRRPLRAISCGAGRSRAA